MSIARIVARNLAANWVGHAANVVVMFFLSPFIVDSLGKVQYGIWGLLVVLTGYLGVLDLGIRAGTGRYIILYTGMADDKRVNDTIRTSLGLFAALGGMVLLLSPAIGWWFPDVFRSVPGHYRNVLLAVLPLVAVNIILTAAGTTFSSVLVARDRYDLVQVVNLSVLAVRTVGTVLALLALRREHRMLGLAAALVGSQVLGLVANFVLARRVFPRLRAWPFRMSRDRLKELGGYGLAAFVSAVAYRVIHQTDLIVVETCMKDVALVTVFAIGAMLPEYVWGLVDQVVRTFFPPIQRAAARDDMHSAHVLYVRQVRTAMLVAIPIYLGILLLGGPFLRLWMGGRGELTATDLTRAIRVLEFFCVARLIFAFTGPAAMFLSAIGRIRFNAWLAVWEAALNLALSLTFVLVFNGGLAGVAAGTLVSMAAVRGVIQPWRACRESGLGEWGFVMATAAPALLAGAAFYGWCSLVAWWLPDETWAALAGQIALSLAGYAPVGFLLLVHRKDRRRMLRFVTSRFTAAR